jgi:hypothetical protein
MSEEPDAIVMGDATPLFDDRLKSATVTVTLTVRVVVWFTPVTVTVNDVVGVELSVETDSVDGADPFAVNVTALGVTRTWRPPGDDNADKFTGPVNPLRLVTVIEMSCEVPLIIERELGLA